MTAPSAQPQPKSSNVVPMTRPTQTSSAKSPTSATLTPISTVESHPADEPGYGHGV